jgi:hypothetical protein
LISSDVINSKYAIHPSSSLQGKYYVITDGSPQYFWRVLDEAVVAMGFTSLFSKFHIPGWLIMGLAYIVVFLGDIFSALTGTDDLKALILPHLPFPSLLLVMIEYLVIPHSFCIVHDLLQAPQSML